MAIARKVLVAVDALFGRPSGMLTSVCDGLTLKRAWHTRVHRDRGDFVITGCTLCGVRVANLLVSDRLVAPAVVGCCRPDADRQNDCAQCASGKTQSMAYAFFTHNPTSRSAGLSGITDLP